MLLLAIFAWDYIFQIGSKHSPNNETESHHFEAKGCCLVRDVLVDRLAGHAHAQVLLVKKPGGQLKKSKLRNNLHLVLNVVA